MTPIRNATALASVLTLVIGTAAGAQSGAQPDDPEKLKMLQKLCAIPGAAPKGVDCDQVDEALKAVDSAEPAAPAAEPEQQAKPKDALDDALKKPKKAKKADKADKPEQAEKPAQADTPKSDSPVAEVPEAPAVTAPAPAPDAPPKQAETPRAPEPEAPAQRADAPPAPAAETPRAEVAKPDPLAQIEALRRQLGAPPAAAAENPPDAGELVEETVDRDDVRRSSEDFQTDLSGKVKNRDKAKKDDDDGLDPLAKIAIIGLGAVALSEILDKDDRVVSNSGDRVVVEQGGQFRVIRNDDVLLRRPGAEVETRRFDDGSTRTRLTYEDGTEVETIRAADGRVLRRVRRLPDGTDVVLFDDTQASPDVEISDLPRAQERNRVDYRDIEEDALARALAANGAPGVNRSFSLAQVRNIDAVRHLVPEITVDTIQFETNSAAIRVDEAEELAALGNAMRDAIERNPAEVFLIEGHTDAVGSYAYNLALSDRRAESVALALTEYFEVPPENMVLQGYGEGDLLVPTDVAERANRRAAVRRITTLLSVR
ncbi:OmpA family protein [Antarctobacter heliothermus]|uniref:Outer membrane protein OmpA n=1 Tax=Antarctobacter heliothermus TaxID=74033 RepID=A0A239AS31_9RHOB|nr:OmpA family protein [Antarctobacter heliothermus]SNR98516.1 Outer membrane protein OmpA [Antarctobacter heliothermus]